MPLPRRQNPKYASVLQDTHGLLLLDSVQRFMTVDPLMDMEPGQSPYAYVSNNPVVYTDPTGMHKETTIVGDNGDGTYTVLDWEDDECTDVVLEDGTKIGNTKTPYSFVNKGKAVKGAIINMNSTEGQDFIDDEVIKPKVGLFYYMFNATNGGDYDIKDRGFDENGSVTITQHRYRGSVDSDGDIGSARDFGNIGAGIVAARNGFGWNTARNFGFDAYQSYKNSSWKRGTYFPDINFGREGEPTQAAQRVGFDIGGNLRRSDKLKKKASNNYWLR